MSPGRDFRPPAGARVCAFRWMAPRAELPESVPVHHVCMGELRHAGYYHGCACGVTLLDEPAPEADDY